MADHERGEGRSMKRWNRRHKNILFVLLVLLAFLSMPLYLDYLPAAERLGIYFLEIEGIRGPFLWVPALLCRGGMEAQTCCKLYIFLVNLGGLLASFYCFSQVARNCYAGLAATFCYCFSVYYVYVYMVRGSLGEMTAFVFLPIYGLGLWRLYTWETGRKDYWKSGVPLTLGLQGIWLSCVPLGLVFSGFMLLIALYAGYGGAGNRPDVVFWLYEEKDGTGPGRKACAAFWGRRHAYEFVEFSLDKDPVPERHDGKAGLQHSVPKPISYDSHAAAVL